MASEIVALQVDWGMVPVAVQARFAQGDDARMIEQGDHGIPIVRRRLGTGIRVDADGGEDRLVRFSDADGRAAAGRGSAQRDHDFYTGRNGTGYNGVAIGLELLVVEMAVGVDHRIPASP
jgi:hypothetical protein